MNTWILSVSIRIIVLSYLIGPAVHRKDDKPVLLGTTSFGDITCKDNKNSFYTNILMFQDWMELTMRTSGTNFQLSILYYF